jgi:hypothetical protein
MISRGSKPCSRPTGPSGSLGCTPRARRSPRILPR